MKIQLTLEEIWVLQETNRGKYYEGVVRHICFWELKDYGLIHEWYKPEAGYVSCLTELGKKVLNQHLPVKIGDHSLLLPIIHQKRRR